MLTTVQQNSAWVSFKKGSHRRLNANVRRFPCPLVSHGRNLCQLVRVLSDPQYLSFYDVCSDNNNNHSLLWITTAWLRRFLGVGTWGDSSIVIRASSRCWAFIASLFNSLSRFLISRTTSSIGFPYSRCAFSRNIGSRTDSTCATVAG